MLCYYIYTSIVFKMLFYILHWYFLALCKPHPIWHTVVSVIGSLVLKCILKKRLKWRKNIQGTLGLACMYLGFYLSPRLYNFCFLPWWGVTVIGLRQREAAIVLGGIIIGIYWHFLVVGEVIGHCAMNIGKLLQVDIINLRTLIMSNLIVGFIFSLYRYDTIQFTSRECIIIASSFQLLTQKIPMDVFSISMCYSNLLALPASLYNVLLPKWYHHYKNNHFYRVKYQYTYVIPIGLLLYRLVYAYIQG